MPHESGKAGRLGYRLIVALVGLVLWGRVAVPSPADAGSLSKEAEPSVFCRFICIRRTLAS
jgi:hypothetical protein